MEKLISYLRPQFIKIRTFAELVVAIVLDALLILSVWGIRKVIIWIIGVDPAELKDRQLFWVVRLSELSTITILAIYIISDILRHLLKAYKDIKNDFKE